MAEPHTHKGPVTLEVLLVSGPSQTDAPAKLLIEKVLITRDKFMEKLAEERATMPQRRLRRRLGAFFSQALLLVKSQTIIPITSNTRTTPTQTPAWKISPSTSHPARAIVERSKSTNRYQECFMGVVRCGWYA